MKTKMLCNFDEYDSKFSFIHSGMPPVLKDVKSKQIPKYIHSVWVFNICTWINCDLDHNDGSLPFHS